ncbi:glycoside hydrolase N-terminal domain-containing protein [Halalkalibacter sp. AB-rgal2]|uniref:glycosyl hydrolase family 95 catalytic domain-containing protein n=1 Tax=Halalkalibacter sp. AB-rgal2 TaxID=3242695 RepID=UPI00359DDD7F
MTSQSNHRYPKRGIVSKKPADQWQEAMITGNGELGALIFGQPLEETIIFNHEKLYEPLHEQIIQNNNMSPYLGEIRELMKEGKFRDAAELFSNKSGHPLLFTDAYHPAFALKLQMSNCDRICDYDRSINFETGEVTVSWSDDRGRVVRKQFVSREDHVSVISLTTISNEEMSLELSIDDLVLEGSAREKHISTDERFLAFSCAYAKTKKGYAGGTVVITPMGGHVEVHGKTLTVSGAKEVILLTKIKPIDDYDQQAPSTLASIKKALKAISSKGYVELLTSHIRIHGEWFNRMSLTICDREDTQKPTEELLVSDQSLNKALLQQMFDMGRYVFISSSGSYPPNLVGLWTGEWRPAWNGDFTTDANVNLAVSGGGIGNMPEALEGYFQLIEKIVPDWRINAQTFFGCRGVLAGSKTDGNHNIHTHFDVDWPLGFWTAGAQWLMLPFYEWYQISGDDAFFIQRVLPIMKEIALFYEDFLTEYNDDGTFMFIPSYSPENTPRISNDLQKEGWQPNQASINATMDVAAARELFTSLIVTCQELGIERESIPKWKDMLANMPDYAINEDGALKEWIHPQLDDEYDHRHVSHLYPVWPGHEVTPEVTPEWFEASKVALEKRGRENYSAHGVVHCALVAARQKNADRVVDNLKLLLQEGDYIHSSLVTSHNPNRDIYNVDASCSLPTLVMEMLAYTSPGLIELLPAVPEEIRKGVITGMRARGQVVIEKLEWDLGVGDVNVYLRSLKKQEVTVRLRQGIEKAWNSENETIFIHNNTDLSIHLNKDEERHIKIKLS